MTSNPVEGSEINTAKNSQYELQSKTQIKNINKIWL